MNKDQPELSQPDPWVAVLTDPSTVPAATWGANPAESWETIHREGRTLSLEVHPTTLNGSVIGPYSDFTDPKMAQGLVEVMILPSQKAYYDDYD